MGLDMYAVRRIELPEGQEIKGRRYVAQIGDDGQPVLGDELVSTSTIEEDVMYWRKANHIHGWFVDNVQNGEDDQRDYYVNWEQLRDLLSTCNKVIEASKLVDGMIYRGTVYSQDHPDGLVEREPGKVIEDPTVAKRLLPTLDGFFFGCTEYDEDYLNNVIETRDWAERMLGEHKDGAPGEIYYSSWW